jgi:hypothetical protein
MKLTNVVLVVSSLAFQVSAHYKEKGSPLRKLAKKAGKKEGKKTSAISTASALSLLLSSDTYDALALNSPQKMAIDWILGQAGLAALLEPDQSDKLLELLSIVVFYYATTGGGGWSNNHGFLVGVDPCVWVTVDQGVIACVDGKVTELYICKFTCVVNGFVIDSYATRSLIQKDLGYLLSCSFHSDQCNVW